MPTFKFEMAFERLKSRKTLGVDQIIAELVLEGDGTVKISVRLLCV